MLVEGAITGLGREVRMGKEHPGDMRSKYIRKG